MACRSSRSGSKNAARGSGFDDDGKSYKRLDLTILHRVALGDRWAGEIKIAGISIHVTTTGSLPGQDMKPKDLEARRPQGAAEDGFGV